MKETFYIHTFPNGLTLLGQPMPEVTSAAMSLWVRAGAAYDTDETAGLAAVASEWLFRGAGDKDSRAFNDALDALGCQHHESVTSEHLQLSAAQLGRNLYDVLDLYADLMLEPRFDDDAFDPCRQLIAQDLDALADEPARWCTSLLRERFFPHPLGRMALGTDASLASLSAPTVRTHARRHINPHGAILAVAGAIDFDRLRDHVEQRLGLWTGENVARPVTLPALGGIEHIEKESAQTYITLAHRAPAIESHDYYPVRVAETILSRGMGSRLFTEVREKRGLAYHVSCSYGCLHDQAGLFTFAGTRPEVAQETWDVTIDVLRNLAQGVQAEELTRAETQLRSSLIMQGQSTGARASALAADWYQLGRLRTLDEISAAIKDVSEDDVLAAVAAYPATNFTALTMGPAAIQTTDREAD